MFVNCCQTQFPQIYNCNFRKNFSDLLNDRSIVQITNYLWKSKSRPSAATKTPAHKRPQNRTTIKSKVSTKVDKA